MGNKKESVMDYEKKYKEALALARSYYDKDSMNAFLDTIFPELHESEDERIRKALIELVGLVPDYMFGEIKPNKFIAYLEKQKERQRLGAETKMAANQRNCSHRHLSGVSSPEQNGVRNILWAFAK